MKTTSGKILASVALVGTAAAVAGMGTYGAFTSTTSASQAVTAATTVISLTGTNTLAVAVTGLLPGDSVEKFVTLSNPAGSSDLNAVTLTTTSPTPATANVLTTDGTNGLQLTIESCTAAWTVVAAGADTCSGTTTTVLAKTSIIGANRALAGLASLTAAGADNLKVTTSLPTSADNTFQGLTSTITFKFDATQRTGSVK
ncbi:CalY family protein [Arthrobacter sp. ISL-48]|uniref:CalY family protein n=1 Tax=Arthrobacter sp. ISL-48 TaxID=2819110 RepID=UPI002035C807|nr:CalY family protein [Arthrobacter sp. ISL-48]